MNDPTRYRARVVEVQAIRWLGIENCEQVFAFLGWHHPNDELDHSAIRGIGDDETAYPGMWIVRTGPDQDDCKVYLDEQFQAEFDPAEPETFTWGESIGTDHSNICIPVNRGDTWIGDIKLPVKAAQELSDMLADLLDEVAREQQSGRERCCD